MKQPSENIESEMLANWLRVNNYTFTHVANESWLPPKVAMLAAKRKQRMWLSPWFPDFVIILKRKSLLCIELKKQRTKKRNWEYKALSSDGIKISEAQEVWKDNLNSIDNVQCQICFWSKEAINFVINLEERL